MVNKKLNSLKIAQETLNINNKVFNENFKILKESVHNIYYKLYNNLSITLFDMSFREVLLDIKYTKKLIDAIKDSIYIDRVKSEGNCICGEDLININEVRILDKTFYFGDVCIKNFNKDLIPKMNYFSRKMDYIINYKKSLLDKKTLNRYFTHTSIYKIFGDFNYKLDSLDDLENLIDSYPPFEDSKEYYIENNINYNFKNEDLYYILEHYVNIKDLKWLSTKALKNHMIGDEERYEYELTILNIKNIIPFNKLKFNNDFVEDITCRLIKKYKNEQVIEKKSDLIKSKIKSFYNYYESNNYYNYYDWMFDNFQGKK